MDFPSDLVPTARSYNPGDWPTKTFKAMDGAEVRILYGSKRTGMELKLSYSNISDVDADRFLAHYDQQKGTFLPFLFGASRGVRSGWAGRDEALEAASTSNKWRYAGPPGIVNVRPGRSSVTIDLVGVF